MKCIAPEAHYLDSPLPRHSYDPILLLQQLLALFGTQDKSPAPISPLHPRLRHQCPRTLALRSAYRKTVWRNIQHRIISPPPTPSRPAEAHLNTIMSHSPAPARFTAAIRLIRARRKNYNQQTLRRHNLADPARYCRKSGQVTGLSEPSWGETSYSEENPLRSIELDADVDRPMSETCLPGNVGRHSRRPPARYCSSLGQDTGRWVGLGEFHGNSSGFSIDLLSPTDTSHSSSEKSLPWLARYQSPPRAFPSGFDLSLLSLMGQPHTCDVSLALSLLKAIQDIGSHHPAGEHPRT